MLESSVVVINKLSSVVVFAIASDPDAVPEKVGLASVLFDNVSVVSCNTTVPVEFGSVIVVSLVLFSGERSTPFLPVSYTHLTLPTKQPV